MDGHKSDKVGPPMDGGAEAAATPAAAVEPTQRRLDRYVLQHELGNGAMGSVWSAYDPKLMREVAVKIVATQQQDNEKGRNRFVREARAVAALHHPNVVQIFDYSGLDSHTLYLVMEKLDGQDLWNLMHQNQALPEVVAAAIGHELCLALEQAHAAGIIHRDLKPENVFMTEGGRVVLTDFGIVKAIADDAAVEGFDERTEVIGTPGFMAPELMRGKLLTPSTDIFALGALLYNIATLKMPFEGASPVAIFQAAQRGDFVDPRQYAPQLSPEFCAVIAKCLNFAPKKRPRTAQAVRMLLRQVLDNLGVSEMRDDLQAYMANPEALAQQALRRATRHVLSRLKSAAADKDADLVQKLGARARILDPFNEEVNHILALTAKARRAPVAQALAGLTSLLSGAEWFLQGPRPAAAAAQQAAPAPLTALPAEDRPTALPPVADTVRTEPVTAPQLGVSNLFAAGLLAVGVALGSFGLALVIDRPHSVVVEQGQPAPGAQAVAQASRPSAPPPAGLDALLQQNTPARPGATAPAAPSWMDAPEAAPAVAEPGAVAAEGTPAAGPAEAVGTGYLALAVAAPGRGAWLQLDGKPIGWIHVARLPLAPGRHLLELAAAGGHRLRRWLTVEAGSERALQVNFMRARAAG